MNSEGLAGFIKCQLIDRNCFALASVKVTDVTWSCVSETQICVRFIYLYKRRLLKAIVEKEGKKETKWRRNMRVNSTITQVVKSLDLRWKRLAYLSES